MRASSLVVTLCAAFALGAASSQTAPMTCEESLAKCLANRKQGKPCDILPIPPEALPPTIRDVGYNLQKLRPGVYTVTEGIYFAMIIVMRRRLVVIDIPESGFVVFNDKGVPVGNRMTDAVVEVLNGRVPRRIDVVYSHAHYDHIGGGNFFYDFVKKEYPSAKIRIWGAPDAAEDIRLSRTRRAPVPTEVVRGRTLLFSKLRFKLELHLAEGHSETDLLIYIPPSSKHKGIVMLVDVIFPGWAPFFNYALSDSITRYVRAHKQVLRLDFGIFVGGHLSRLGTRGDVVTGLEFSNSVIDAAEAAQREFTVPQGFEAVQFTNPDSPGFLNVWAGFRAFRDETDRLCADKVIEQWGCKLAGVDQVAVSHCSVAVESVLIEL